MLYIRGTSYLITWSLLLGIDPIIIIMIIIMIMIIIWTTLIHCIQFNATQNVNKKE